MRSIILLSPFLRRCLRQDFAVFSIASLAVISPTMAATRFSLSVLCMANWPGIAMVGTARATVPSMIGTW